MCVESPIYVHRYGEGFDEPVRILAKPSTPCFAGSGGRPAVSYCVAHQAEAFRAAL